MGAMTESAAGGQACSALSPTSKRRLSNCRTSETGPSQYFACVVTGRERHAPRRHGLAGESVPPREVHRVARLHQRARGPRSRGAAGSRRCRMRTSRSCAGCSMRTQASHRRPSRDRHPDIEVRPSIVGGPESDVYRGRDGFRKFLADVEAAWADFRIEVDEVRGLGATVLILGRSFARGEGSGIAVEAATGWIAVVRNGQVHRFASFPGGKRPSKPWGFGSRPRGCLRLLRFGRTRSKIGRDWSPSPTMAGRAVFRFSLVLWRSQRHLRAGLGIFRAWPNTRASSRPRLIRACRSIGTRTTSTSSSCSRPGGAITSPQVPCHGHGPDQPVERVGVRVLVRRIRVA